MFRQVVIQADIEELTRLASDEWQAAAERWASGRKIQLCDEASRSWRAPSAHGQGCRSPRSTLPVSGANWLIGDVRSGRRTAQAGSALEVLAQRHELDGSLLSPRVAAVELLSVLRPTVVELLKGATRFLAGEVEYDVPDQDLGIPRSALPGVPRSGLLISDVRRSGRRVSTRRHA